ncbi:MAG: type 4a pilus biogenesis protein PilO [Proteobacteria bacterium]|nr:type 4a pilus biogenesis protein PilO [Pseudomonadota bacterium]
MDVGFDIDDKLEQLGKLPKNVRLAIVTALIAAAGAAYYFLVYQAAASELAALRNKEQELQRQLNEVRAVAANLTTFEDEVANLERELNLALRQLPNQKELEVLLSDISNLGKRVGVDIVSFERQSEREKAFYAEVPIQLTLEGKFHDVARFFDRIAKLPRIVNVSELKITVASDTADATVLKVVGTATTFRFLGEEANQRKDNRRRRRGGRA